MHNYNEDYFRWLRKIQDLDITPEEDLPPDLDKEFQQLLLLAEIPFKDVFGETPGHMEDLLHICLPPGEFYDKHGKALNIVDLERDKVLVSPVTREVLQVPLYARDSRDRRFVFQYCGWSGPNPRADAAIYDTCNGEFFDRNLAPEDYPEVFIIYITDCDILQEGGAAYCLDFRRNSDEPIQYPPDVDPNQPEPIVDNWRLVFVNAKAI